MERNDTCFSPRIITSTGTELPRSREIKLQRCLFFSEKHEKYMGAQCYRVGAMKRSSSQEREKREIRAAGGGMTGVIEVGDVRF